MYGIHSQCESHDTVTSVNVLQRIGVCENTRSKGVDAESVLLITNALATFRGQECAVGLPYVKQQYGGAITAVHILFRQIVVVCCLRARDDEPVQRVIKTEAYLIGNTVALVGINGQIQQGDTVTTVDGAQVGKIDTGLIELLTVEDILLVIANRNI